MNQEKSLTTRHIAMPPEFEDVFSQFYYALNNSTEPIEQKLLPNFQTILAFSLSGKTTLNAEHAIEIDKVIILSTVKKLLEYTLFPGAEMLVVNFKADSFFRFFGGLKSGEEFLIQPDDLLEEDCFTELWQKIKPLASVDEKAEAILDFCRPYLKERPFASEQLVAHQESGGSYSPIKFIAAVNRQSIRTVQMNYKKFFGYTDKEKSRYERFIKAVKMVDRSTAQNAEVDWFEIIVECSYYDQSQLIHDFNYYLKLSPTQYLKQQQDICTARQ